MLFKSFVLIVEVKFLVFLLLIVFIEGSHLFLRLFQFLFHLLLIVLIHLQTVLLSLLLYLLEVSYLLQYEVVPDLCFTCYSCQHLFMLYLTPIEFVLDNLHLDVKRLSLLSVPLLSPLFQLPPSLSVLLLSPIHLLPSLSLQQHLLLVG